MLVDEVLEQTGKGSSSTLPGARGINESSNLSLWCALLAEQWKQGAFLEVSKGPEELQIWKGNLLMGSMLPEKVVNRHLKEYSMPAQERDGL